MLLGVHCDVDIVKLTASAQSIYREVYDIQYLSPIIFDNALISVPFNIFIWLWKYIFSIIS